MGESFLGDGDFFLGDVGALADDLWREGLRLALLLLELLLLLPLDDPVLEDEDERDESLLLLLFLL